MVSMKRRGLLIGSLALAGAAHAKIKPDTRVTLLAGDSADGIWRAGIDIDIGPEWKTYWRMPGDAGIPPSFDWSGSENARDVEVLWPVPSRFHDLAGETIGYKTHVLFPLRVTPEDAAKPVALKLKLFFAVCKDICIPSDAESAVLLDRADPGGASRIAAAEARVPRPGEPIRLARLGLHPGPVIELDMVQEPGLDIFVEGAEPVYIRAPERKRGGYRLDIAGQPRDALALKGKSLRFTVAGADALEQTVAVD
jgi:DsbC/DsbD-like thiol-disulfide interchange protein